MQKDLSQMLFCCSFQVNSSCWEANDWMPWQDLLCKHNELFRPVWMNDKLLDFWEHTTKVFVNTALGSEQINQSGLRCWTESFYLSILFPFLFSESVQLEECHLEGINASEFYLATAHLPEELIDRYRCKLSSVDLWPFWFCCLVLLQNEGLSGLLNCNSSSSQSIISNSKKNGHVFVVFNLVRCTWKKKACIISEHWSSMVTEFGVCYTFNYHLPGFSTEDTGDHEEQSMIWQICLIALLKNICCHENMGLRETWISGPGSGLTLLLNIEHYEYMRGQQLDTGAKVGATFLVVLPRGYSTTSRYNPLWLISTLWMTFCIIVGHLWNLGKLVLPWWKKN